MSHNHLSLITDDSRTMFQINCKKNSRNLLNKTEIVTLLKEMGLECPTNDIENEAKYAACLNNHINKSELLFSGTFTEVKNYYHFIRKYIPTDLHIISYRYGLISSELKIVPYQCP